MSELEELFLAIDGKKFIELNLHNHHGDSFGFSFVSVGSNGSGRAVYYKANLSSVSELVKEIKTCMCDCLKTCEKDKSNVKEVKNVKGVTGVTKVKNVVVEL